VSQPAAERKMTVLFARGFGIMLRAGRAARRRDGLVAAHV
jgi:hypothetical protein